MWIYEHKNWPNFTWDIKALSLKLANLRHQQGCLLGRMQVLGFESQREATLNILTSDVIKSSAIEGEKLDPSEVRSSLARRLGIDVGGLVPSSRNVEGIVEVMLDATQKFNAPLTKERLFSWHAALFPTGRSGMSKITVGNWRDGTAGPMQVISGPIGREKVHFEAPVASQVDDEMTTFIKWFESANDIDPVLKSGVAHLWFVTIHPFEDGNGRIARVIADMALARADGRSERFYSLSSQIEAERKDYYDNLERQQSATPEITAWLDWFLDCLGRAVANAEKSLGKVLYKAQLWQLLNKEQVSERQRKVINKMLDDSFVGFINTSKYAKLAKCSNDTALRDIQELKERGILVQNPGKGRSTSYKLVSELWRN